MVVKKINSNTYDNGDIAVIGGNSVTFAMRDFVTKTGGFLVLSTAGDTILGVSKENATMASDNQTVGKIKVVVEEQKPQTTFEVTITGGTITIADEGKYYDLATTTTVDGTSESTTTGQLQLVKFISATLCLFKIVNL
jgi:hypothetical protein